MRMVGVAALGVVGCFDPHPLPGSACLADGRCPDGLACIAGVCQLGGGVDGPLGSDSDVDIPDGPLLPDASSCVSWQVPNLGDACLLIAPGMIDLSGEQAWLVDTDTGEIRHGNVSMLPPSTVIAGVRVFSLVDLTIDAGVDVDVAGMLGVIFVVHGSARIDGSLAASAALADDGAGAPSSACEVAGDATTGTSAGGGGGGGGFGKDGGDGGDGDSFGGTGGMPGMRGGQSGSLSLVPLLAGCRGGVGAGPAATAPGGGGGGAIEISARDALLVGGVVAANGGGGAGGAAHVGGGGGGSGGGILLEASDVVIAGTATVVANGGGGGGGGGFISGGGTGGDGRLDDQAAPGGMGPLGGGGAGGDGGHRNNDSGQNAGSAMTASSGGGGGGGGGVGRIRIQARGNRAIDPNATISPAPD
jgi:hypothetical protein